MEIQDMDCFYSFEKCLHSMHCSLSVAKLLLVLNILFPFPLIPWLVVLFHVLWYNSNYAHQGEEDGMMAAMEPLLYTTGVDLVLTGHVHAYERSKRVKNGKSDPCGVVHITIGDGGNIEGLAQRKFSDVVLQEIVKMVLANLFRTLNPQPRVNKVVEGLDLEEEEPSMDPA